MEPKMLDRSKPNTDPMGNEWKIVPSKMYPGLLEIRTNDPRKHAPEKLRGHWTGFDKANAALQSHLDIMWAEVEEQKAKAERRTGAKKEPEERAAAAR